MNEIRKTKNSNIWIIILSLVISVSVTGVGIYAAKNISKSQYEERVENSNILMEKICHHIATVVNFHWQNIHYVSDQIENEKFTSLTEMLDFTEFSEKTIKDNTNTKILLISDDGFCYVTDGTTFKWVSPSVLNEKNDVMYISDHQFASKTGVQMYYFSRFENPFVVEEITFTHAALVCDMKELDSFFDVSNYGEDSITFIIHKDGSQVYRQNKETHLSGIYNLISALKDAEFKYGMSHEKFVENISSGNSDTVYLSLDNINYFVSYYNLGIKDWVVVLMVPEEYVGAETRVFAKEIIVSVILIFSTFILALLSIFFVSAHQIKQKQKLVNERLIKAAEAERAANEAKTNFLSSMSHDIRTPMNAITGMVTIASKRIDDTEYIKECLEKIKLASGHLLTLINDILDISKVESGKMKLNNENFSLTECFTNLVNIMQPQIKEKNQDFFIRVHNVQNEYLFGDKLRLNQIFINLLSNAIKYTQENGTISVDLYQEPIVNINNMVRLTYVVCDNGMGMSEEFQQNMYQSFSRATDSRTSKTQGSGLGLAICKQMVDLMGGVIKCNSVLGEGTTFTVIIDLPIAEVEKEDLYLPEMEILLVDDDEIFLETASETLESLGATVTSISNSRKAIEDVKKRHNQGNDYPVIIIDKKLPDINGFETVRQIRQIINTEIPIIMVSAYDTSVFEEEAKNAGANGVISKPFFKSEVYDNINRCIGKKETKHQEDESAFSDLSGIKILVAEDNDLNWEIADTFLQLYNIEAERAENGEKCIEMMNNAETNYYSLVLMDVRMPVMDGRAATRILRSSEKEWINSIPIIAMTADAFTEDIHECLEAGMNEHIAKPLDMKRLLRILKKYKV